MVYELATKNPQKNPSHMQVEHCRCMRSTSIQGELTKQTSTMMTNPSINTPLMLLFCSSLFCASAPYIVVPEEL